MILVHKDENKVRGDVRGRARARFRENVAHLPTLSVIDDDGTSFPVPEFACLIMV